MPVVPREMITRADQLGFPLLEMPEDMPYSVCMEAAYDLLKDSRLFELRIVTHLHNELRRPGSMTASAGSAVRWKNGCAARSPYGMPPGGCAMEANGSRFWTNS